MKLNSEWISQATNPTTYLKQQINQNKSQTVNEIVGNREKKIAHTKHNNIICICHGIGGIRGVLLHEAIGATMRKSVKIQQYNTIK